jgi:hypothetical protein
MEDLFGIDADPSPCSLQPGSVNGEVQTGQRRYASLRLRTSKCSSANPVLRTTDV